MLRRQIRERRLASAKTVQDTNAQSHNDTNAVKNPRYLSTLKEYKILMEFKMLRYRCPTGVYVMPVAHNLRLWHGVIFIRSGKYRNGVFKFVIELTHYPKKGPRVMFSSKVFNPLINIRTGELDLSIQFPEWDSTQHNVVLVLFYIKAIFYKPNFWGKRMRHPAFNRDAQLAWLRQNGLFEKHCQTCVDLSLRRIHKNRKDSSIRFARHQHEHSLALNRIFREDFVDSTEKQCEQQGQGTGEAATAVSTPTGTSARRDASQPSQPSHDVSESAKEGHLPASSYASWFSNGVNSLTAYQQRFLTPQRSSHLGISPMESAAAAEVAVATARSQPSSANE